MNDTFVTRLDPTVTGERQLRYSTLFGKGGGGVGGALTRALHVDAIGLATVGGNSYGAQMPTTLGAYSRTWGGSTDGFLARFDMLPAGVARIGSSSPGCNGPLAMDATSWPQAGNAGFALTTGNARASSSGLLLLSGSSLSTPINFLGADLWVSLTPFVMLPASSNAEGVVEFPLPIPANPQLVGASLYAQFVWSDSGPPPCPPMGVAASNALQITIQP